MMMKSADSERMPLTLRHVVVLLLAAVYVHNEVQVLRPVKVLAREAAAEDDDGIAVEGDDEEKWVEIQENPVRQAFVVMLLGLLDHLLDAPRPSADAPPWPTADQLLQTLDQFQADEDSESPGELMNVLTDEVSQCDTQVTRLMHTTSTLPPDRLFVLKPGCPVGFYA
jgi:hypothetical protein